MRSSPGFTLPCGVFVKLFYRCLNLSTALAVKTTAGWSVLDFNKIFTGTSLSGRSIPVETAERLKLSITMKLWVCQPRDQRSRAKAHFRPSLRELALLALTFRGRICFFLSGFPYLCAFLNCQEFSQHYAIIHSLPGRITYGNLHSVCIPSLETMGFALDDSNEDVLL